jgi:hypothetical protein
MSELAVVYESAKEPQGVSLRDVCEETGVDLFDHGDCTGSERCSALPHPDAACASVSGVDLAMNQPFRSSVRRTCEVILTSVPAIGAIPSASVDALWDGRQDIRTSTNAQNAPRDPLAHRTFRLLTKRVAL